MNGLKLDPPWKQAVEDAHMKFDYGDTIMKDWLMAAFMITPAKTLQEVDKERFAWLQSMTEFRELFSEKYHKELRSIPGVGYQIVKPHEQTDFARDEGSKDLRRVFHRYERRLTNIEARLLDLEQGKHNSEQRNKLAAIKTFSRKQLE